MSRPISTAQRLRLRLEEAVERALVVLDTMDGDPDLEPALAIEELLDQRLWAARVGLGDDREEECEDEGAQCEDEGGACEGEGDHDEREPDEFHCCNWQDEGDQTVLRQLPMISRSVSRTADRNFPSSNVRSGPLAGERPWLRPALSARL